MSISQPGFITDHLLVKLHQLCKCCQPLAGELIRFYSTKQENANVRWNHYEALQDLIRGTRGGCHFCNMAYDSVKRNCKRIDEQVPSWLRTSIPGDPSEDLASKTKINTEARPDILDAIQINVEIYDGHQYQGLFFISFQDPLSTPINPYTEV